MPRGIAGVTTPRPLDGEFAGRRVVVTGAGSGMGLATAGCSWSVAHPWSAWRAPMAASRAIGGRRRRALAVRRDDRRPTATTSCRQAGTIDCLVIAHGETTGQPSVVTRTTTD